MAQIDALLRMLRNQEGDRLVVEAGRSPMFSRQGSPLRMTFPATSAAGLRELCDELLDADGRARRERGDTVALAHEVPGLGAFRAQLDASVARFDWAGAASSAAESNAPSETRTQLDSVVGEVVRMGATDLHLITGGPAMFRVDGALRPLGGDVDPAHALTWLDDAARAHLDSGGTVDLARSVGEVRVRAHLYRTEAGLAAALRFLRSDIGSIESLNLPPEVAALAGLDSGLVLVGGATGSGKTTTLVALAVERLRRRGGLLVTLEQPIEVLIPAPRGALVRQREVGRHVADFPSGLRDALREDPDVLLVGEMRDPESISLAITAAETGRLVFATLHARSAASCVERIVDAYPPERQAHVRGQVAGVLEATLVQRLVPVARGAGRVPVVEVARATSAVRHLIRDGQTEKLESAILTGRDHGMRSFDQSYRAWVASGRLAGDPST